MSNYPPYCPCPCERQSSFDSSSNSLPSIVLGPLKGFRIKLVTMPVCQAFSKMFNMAPDDLDMHVVYDVSHNIAKVEEHVVNGRPKTLLVHRYYSRGFELLEKLA